MDYKNMFMKGIESDRQSLSAYIKKHGYYENMGQIEYTNFQDKINMNDMLSYAQKAELCGLYEKMLNNL